MADNTLKSELRNTWESAAPGWAKWEHVFEGDGVLEPLFKDNGLGDVKTEAVRAPLVVSSASDALQLLQEAAGAYRAVVADLSDAERSKAWGEVYECLKQFEAGRGFQTQLELIVGPGARLSKF
jgi:predicted membrane-bound spermidine synthase